MIQIIKSMNRKGAEQQNIQEMTIRTVVNQDQRQA